MNNIIKNIILIFVIIILFSCKKEYSDIGEKEKNIFLFYAYNLNDKFKMIRYYGNNKDTVVQKDLEYVKKYNNYYQYYIMAYTCDSTINYNGEYNSGGVFLTKEDTALFLNELKVTTLIKENDTITINGIFFDKLYKLTSTNKYDNSQNNFALISKEYGIVKMWNENVVYEIIH